MKKRHYIIPVFVPHEGCPHNCVFCNQEAITGSSSVVTGEFVNNTINEYLKTIKKENSIIEVSFFGGTFTAVDINKQKELLEVARSFKERNEIQYIRLSTRPDYIDKNILNHLKEYSVDIIELGVQSLDEEVLRKSGRGHTEQDVITATELIKAYGFQLGHQIMLGLPGDDFNKDIETAEKIVALAPGIVRIYPSLVIRNTPMEKMFMRGDYKPYTLEEAVEISKIIMGMFLANGIKVIRVGLQPTDEINTGKELIAGPFHPAFRELVEGSVYNDMLLKEIPFEYKGDIEVRINSKDISKLFCNGKKFFNDMKNKSSSKNMKIIQDDKVERGIIILKLNEKERTLSFFDFFTKKENQTF